MYEYVLGNFVIPIMLLILVLLAIGKGRRVINGIVIHAINISMHVSGIKVRIFPLLAFVNVFYFVIMMERITGLKALHSKENPIAH